MGIADDLRPVVVVGAGDAVWGCCCVVVVVVAAPPPPPMEVTGMMDSRARICAPLSLSSARRARRCCSSCARFSVWEL